jgi:hypothetical protein
MRMDVIMEVGPAIKGTEGLAGQMRLGGAVKVPFHTPRVGKNGREKPGAQQGPSALYFFAQ